MYVLIKITNKLAEGDGPSSSSFSLRAMEGSLNESKCRAVVSAGKVMNLNRLAPRIRTFLAVASALSVLLMQSTGCRKEADALPQNVTTLVAPLTVEVHSVTSMEIPLTIRATGSFTPKESSDVNPQESGLVIMTSVQVGDVVQAGQVVARLDDRDARAKLQQANASLQQAQATAANAKAEQRRAAALVKTGDISQSDYEKLETQVATAEAQVAQSESQVVLAKRVLDEMVVRAPFRGHISARQAASGQYVTTGSKIATVAQIQPIKLELQVPESDAAQMRLGMAVSAQVASQPGREFVGKITANNPAINPESRAMTVIAEFSNQDLKLNPGMFATAEIHLLQTTKALFVPKSAVFSPSGGSAYEVFVALDGKARLKVVQLGDSENGLVRILSGLQTSDHVIITQPERLFDGQAIAAH